MRIARQRQHLADLDADVEGDDLGDQPGARQREVLQLGRQAEAVDEPEDQHRRLRVSGWTPNQRRKAPRLSSAL